MSDEIHNDPFSKIGGSFPVEGVKEGQRKAVCPESGVSSIKRSRSVKPEVVPVLNFPILTPPSEECKGFAIASIDAAGNPILTALYHLDTDEEVDKEVVLREEEIKKSALNGWMNNIREIEEFVQLLLASPVYQQLQELLKSRDFQQGDGLVASAAGKEGKIDLLSMVDRLKILEKIPSTTEVTGIQSGDDSSDVLVLPLTAVMLAGGGFAVGSESLSSANPVGGVMEMVEKIQPMFPAVSLEDLIPVINLMVVGPLYFNSWNEAIGSLKGRKKKGHIPAIHNFVKDVIKIVTDPNFINTTLVSRMRGTESLSAPDQRKLASMLKMVLIGVGLSLLYSIEVGKVQNGKYGGIEPEELRDLLMGKWRVITEKGKKLTEHELLTNSLIDRAREQLELLTEDDRRTAIEILLDYVTQKRDVDPMLDPVKIFNEVISSSQFNPRDQAGGIQG